MAIQQPLNQENSKTLQPEFNIARIYLKDLSFEAPHIPEIFRNEWQPQCQVNLNVDSKEVDKDIYEVVLTVSVSAKLKEQNAFLVEAKEAGLFQIRNFPKEDMESLLKSFCPSILFPYVRELISETINRGTFPPFYLAPVNFDALYAEQQQQAKNNPTENR